MVKIRAVFMAGLVTAVIGWTAPEAVAQGSSGVLAACILDPDHDGAGRVLRIVGPTERCRRHETRVSWNTIGPQGPKGDDGPAASVPPGAVLFFNLEACPAGWTEFLAAQGRYLVGLPPHGTAGAAVGTALADREDRPVGQHSHGVNDPSHSHGFFDLFLKTQPPQFGLPGSIASGANLRTDSASTEHSTSTATTGITINAAGAISGTNAPYVQLLACEKD
jgi:hypothetical protein